MGQVTVTVNGRTYRLRCGDGEEPRLIELATHVGNRIDGLAAEFGQVGDERLSLWQLCWSPTSCGIPANGWPNRKPAKARLMVRHRFPRIRNRSLIR